MFRSPAASQSLKAAEVLLLKCIQLWKTYLGFHEEEEVSGIFVPAVDKPSCRKRPTEAYLENCKASLQVFSGGIISVFVELPKHCLLSAFYHVPSTWTTEHKMATDSGEILVTY